MIQSSKDDDSADADDDRQALLGMLWEETRLRLDETALQKVSLKRHPMSRL